MQTEALLDFRMSDQPAADQPSTVTVRMDADLVRMARIVCAHTPGRGANQLKLVDYLDRLVRDKITADYEEAMQNVIREQGGSKKPRRKGSD